MTTEEMPGFMSAANLACDTDEVADWVNVVDPGSVVLAPLGSKVMTECVVV